MSKFKKSITARFTRSKCEQNVSHYGDVVLFGAHKVGKTSIADRFVNNYFTEQYLPTPGEARYAVDALIEIENNEDETEKKERKLILKKSFKNSVLGTSRPPLVQKKKTMKRVVSTNVNVDENASHAYNAGIAKGLKRLKFVLVDTPCNFCEMEPLAYQATISNAAGFFLVCSFDVPESLRYVESRIKDIRNAKTNSADTPIIIIANKSDIPDDKRLINEHEINSLAAQLNVKCCCASVATKEGCEDMSGLLLNEINISAEKEEFLHSLPEDDAYFGDH